MVELKEVFGNDLMIVNVARVSYGKESKEFSDKDKKLLKYLWLHQHTSPFRHPQLQFKIQCPIFVERQLRKHEVGLELGSVNFENTSVNSISGRYVDFSDSYFKLKELRKQSKDSKQGSGERFDVEKESYLFEKIENQIDRSKLVYELLIQNDVSKEQARTVLPQSLNTEFIWTGSLLSFLHLFSLRLKKDAQKETRELVQEMYNLLKQNGSFPETLNIFEKYETSPKEQISIEDELAKILCRDRISRDSSLSEEEFIIDCYNKIEKNDIIQKAIRRGFDRLSL